MKLWLASLALLPLLAQDPPPVPSTEPAVTGSVDLGYRWRSDVAGSFDAYRSIVNLGSGPKLFDIDLSIISPSRRFFDRMEIRGNNWGDPYNTARLDVSRHDWYNLKVDYRNIAYFNFLPSFADPTAVAGVFLNQSSFDTHRRLANVELELLPGKWFMPYLAYTHDSGTGTGITDFVSDANEYPVATHLRDKTDSFRGGVRFEMRRFHVTLEQGGSIFKDDQQVFTDDANSGNRSTSFLGQDLALTNLAQAYGIRGNSIYSKVLLTASPTPWLDISGQFLYSRPQTDVNYTQSNNGLFVDLSTLLFFNSQLDLLSAAAKQPHTTASLGFELRPFRRLRIVESWMTDRLHNASTAQLTDQMLTPIAGVQLTGFADRLVWNYNQQQVDVFFDLTRRLTIHGGHRYLWGDALTRGGLISDAATQTGQVRRQVGLAGLNFRASQHLNVNADLEAASGDRAYFRTSLQDYRKGRVRARYQPTTALTVSAAFSILDNQNPDPTIHYDFQSRATSLSVLWSPSLLGKRFSLTGDYTRSTLRSDISYLIPQTLETALSRYRDNAHIASGLVDIVLPGFAGQTSRLSVGGSFFQSSGSRPSGYYQPLAKLVLPLRKNAAWVSQWQYYGLSETFYAYEGFHAHLFSTGLRLSR